MTKKRTARKENAADDDPFPKPKDAEGQTIHVQGKEFPGSSTDEMDKWYQVLVLRCEYLMLFKGGPPSVGYWCMEKGEDGNGPDSAEFQLRKSRLVALWRESQAYLLSLQMFDDDGESYNSDDWDMQDDDQEDEDAGTEETAPASKLKPPVYYPSMSSSPRSPFLQKHCRLRSQWGK